MHKSFAHHHRRRRRHIHTQLIEILVNLHVLIFGVVIVETRISHSYVT